MNQSVRVLYLTINPNRESTTRPTECWLRLLRPRGLEPVLVSDRAGALQTWAVEQGIPAYAVPLPFPDKRRPWRLLASLFKLWRIVRRQRIQIIHCNEQDVYPIAQYLGRACGLPVLVGIQYTVTAGFCHWAFAGRRRPRRLFFTSRGNRELSRQAVAALVPESDWRILYNVADTDHYRPEPDRRERFRREHGLEAALVVGTACALRPRKQLEHLFDAVAQLEDPRVQVLLAGRIMPGDEVYAERLLAAARQRFGARFHYLGHCDDVRGVFQALDLLVNTSQEEGFPLSVVEAMSCGCPVVGYPSKVLDELVTPPAGELVPQDRVDLLVDALRSWLDDPARRVQAGAAARQVILSRFAPQSIADQLWNEYLEVLGGQ